MSAARIVCDRRLLGYLQARNDPRVEALARQLCVEAEGLLEIRTWSERLDFPEFARIFAAILPLGQDFARRTRGSAAVWLWVASLGPGLETRAAELLRAGQSAAGYLLDRLGSFLVEQEIRALDRAARQSEEQRGLRVGRRFSPGYGDISLAAQPLFLQRCGLPGLSLSEDGVLKPEKTITAFAAVFSGDT